jgi:isopropylmalate/homocitrate/citramalate synthase
MATPWKTDKWFTSPWNFLPEIVSKMEFPSKIKIHDVTLRDGEQQAGIELNKDEKVAIAEKVAELGVHRIEAGMPAVSKQDEEAVKEIVKRKLGPQIFAFCRCMEDDVKRAADCGVDGIVIEIPSSRHLIENAYRWPLEKAIEAPVKATSLAGKLGLYTAFFTIDSSREELDWVLKIIDKVATEGHMDSLVLVDTMGVCTPQAIEYYTRYVKARINKPLEAHFHNDFGLGVANTITALACGAEVAHTTICGIGERSGNASMEETIISLLTLYGQDLGLKVEKLYEVAHLVAELTGYRLPQNKPIIGESLYTIESGIVAAWQEVCRDSLATEVFPLHWNLVGQQAPTIVLGKGSGRPSVQHWLTLMGKKATEEQIDEILVKVKEKSLTKKGLLTEEEFQEIVNRIL